MSSNEISDLKIIGDQIALGPASEADVDLVRRYGGPISHSALLPTCSLFRVPDIEGVLGFRVHHGYAVVLGDPLCQESHQERLISAFLEYTSRKRLSVIFVVVSRRLVEMTLEKFSSAVQFGDLLIGSPLKDPEAGSRGSHLRTSVRFPQKMGVTISFYDGDGSVDDALESRIASAVDRWRSSRQGCQLHIGSHHFFRNRRGCRWFIAEFEGKVIGVLALLRVNHAGCPWLIDLVFSTPDAPPHTNEFLIVTAFRRLREEGVELLSYGVAPSAALGEMIGFRPFAAFLARTFYTLATRLVPQHGKIRFWKKFGVAGKEPLYLVFQEPRIGIRTFRALLEAFNFSI